MNILLTNSITRPFSIFSSALKTRNQRLHQIQYQYSSQSQKIKNKLNLYYRLCRYDKPIGAMLLFWPTAWGVCIGSPSIPSLYYLSLFFMGSWTARSAGCIVNDYFDKDFDKHVARTKTRPLASGQVSNKQALVLLFGNLLGGLIVLFHLPLKAFVITMGIVGIAGVYPLAKRYTNYPQLVLGIAFNSGVIIGSLTMNPDMGLGVMIPLYLSGISWTLIYDTIYAYQDIEDDMKIGIKSTAISWKDKNPKGIMQNCIYINALCHLGMVMGDLSYCYSAIGMLGADYYLLRTLKKLNIKSVRQCGEFFKANNYYGLFIFGSLLLTNVIFWFNSIYFKQQ